MFGRGISREGDILDLAVANNIINKSGAWYGYEGNKIGQGRENAKIYLREHPEVMEEVEQKVRLKYGLLPSGEDSGQEGSAGTPEKTRTRGSSRAQGAKDEDPEEDLFDQLEDEDMDMEQMSDASDQQS